MLHDIYYCLLNPHGQAAGRPSCTHTSGGWWLAACDASWFYSGQDCRVGEDDRLLTDSSIPDRHTWDLWALALGPHRCMHVSLFAEASVAKKKNSLAWQRWQHRSTGGEKARGGFRERITAACKQLSEVSRTSRSEKILRSTVDSGEAWHYWMNGRVAESDSMDKLSASTVRALFFPSPQRLGLAILFGPECCHHNIYILHTSAVPFFNLQCRKWTLY